MLLTFIEIQLKRFCIIILSEFAGFLEMLAPFEYDTINIISNLKSQCDEGNV